ncbi:hypothetical protein JXM83_07240 [Candidatus Woesearchaeota archaeon]|nr:hypothetical protein [Candidatus Woesearchaeota archaeon]
MKKRGVLILVLLAVFMILLKPTLGLTTSPSQIMIPSEYIKSNTELTTDMFLELENGESPKEISFLIPDKYKKNIRIEPSKLTLRKKSTIKIKVYGLQTINPGEHNIEIQILDKNKAITTGINTNIFIKIVAPEKDQIIKKQNNEPEKVPYTLLIVTGLIAILIIVTTFLLSTKINKIKKTKENYFADKFEQKIESQESKVNLLISETTKILENIK